MASLVLYQLSAYLRIYALYLVFYEYLVIGINLTKKHLHLDNLRRTPCC